MEIPRRPRKGQPSIRDLFIIDLSILHKNEQIKLINWAGPSN